MGSNLTAEQNRPVLDKDTETNEWVLTVACAPSIRIPAEQNALAQSIWTAATWAYHNGRRDVQRELKSTLGINP